MKKIVFVLIFVLICIFSISLVWGSSKKTSNKIYYGEWVINKNITPKGIPSIYGNEDIDKMIGKKIIYAKETASYDDKEYKKIFYKKSVVPNNELIYMMNVFYKDIGIDAEECTIIDLYCDKNLTEEWEEPIGSTFIIKDENTLVVWGCGIFLELKRSV